MDTHRHFYMHPWLLVLQIDVFSSSFSKLKPPQWFLFSICIRRKCTLFTCCIKYIIQPAHIGYVMVCHTICLTCNCLLACTCLISFWWFFWGSNTSKTGRSSGCSCQVTCVLPVPGGPWITVQVVRKADFLSDTDAFRNANQHNSQWFLPGWLHTL